MSKTIAKRIRNEERDRALDLLNEEIGFIDDDSFRSVGIHRLMQEPPAGLVLTVECDGQEDLAPAETPISSILTQSRDIPLLTATQEQWLFQKMNWLKYQANQLRSQIDPEFPDKQIMESVRKLLAEAMRIRNQIVQCNLRLVVSMATKMTAQRNRLEDLVSDGYLSLIRAIEKFDFSRGYRFSTYATHAIQRDAYRRYHQRQRELSRRVPSVWLEGMAGNSDWEPMEDHSGLMSKIRELVESELDEREHFILTARYGLGSQKKPQKLRTIAASLGLSKERVRQLQIRAIEKLQESLSSHAWG